MRYDYYYIENFFTRDESIALYEKMKRADSLGYSDHPAKHVVKTATVDVAPLGAVWEETDKWRNQLLELNRLFFGFDLFQIGKYDTMHMNTYSSKDNAEYGYHIDAALEKEPRDIKLTALANISFEEYTGGEFYLYRGGKEECIEKYNKPGSILLFTSWQYHRVSPVTEGTRVSCSIFLSGPMLR